MRVVGSLGLVVMLTAPPQACAAPRIVLPEALQRSAMSCIGEALRLCPGAMSAKDHGLACILGKRRLLSPPCRTVYDQGVRLLRGEDLHIDLRRPKPSRP